MDKQELRQDPIREKIIAFLSNVENNRTAIAGFFVIAILSITFATYYSLNLERQNKNSEINLGKAINTKIDGDDSETSNLLFSELLASGTSASKSVSFVHLIDYYLSEVDDNIFPVDSLMNMDVDVSDDILKAKLLLLEGDRNLNLEQYDDAIGNYNEALGLDTYMSNEIELRLSRLYLEKGDITKAESIVSALLEKDDLSFSDKDKCNKINSMIQNHVK